LNLSMGSSMIDAMISNSLWWIEALLGVVALIAAQYGVKKFLRRKAYGETEGWKSRIGKIVQPPLTLLLWIVGIFYLVHVIGDRMGFAVVIGYIDALRKAGVVICFVWLFFRWKADFEKVLIADPHKKIDLTTVRMIGRLATIAAGVITGLIILQIFGVNTAPLLAFGSIGAASIGFAGKDVIANFCSGIMLHVTRPFVTGDAIYLPEKALEGYIEEIGWFRTSIRDKEKRAVYLPNNFFSTMLVINISRMTHRRFKQTLKIPFTQADKVELFISKVRDLLQSDPQIDQTQPMFVYLNKFIDHTCEVEIEAYSTIVDQEMFNRHQQQFLLKIQEILHREAIPLAIPTISVLF
jgi:MscS family membrane protein